MHIAFAENRETHIASSNQSNSANEMLTNQCIIEYQWMMM